MTSEGLGEMFEGDSAETCAGKFPLVCMGGRAEGQECADPGARTHTGASRNLCYLACNMDVSYHQPSQGASKRTRLGFNLILSYKNSYPYANLFT